MRILAVSNFYPPNFVGGYEIGCHQVMEALKSRGHQVAVLTSAYGVDEPIEDGGVFRWLSLVDVDPWDRRTLFALELRNQAAFDRVYRRHQPDVVYFWNLARLPVSLALRAEMRGPVCYYISDGWLAQWTRDRWYAAMKTWPSGFRGAINRRLVQSISAVRRLTPSAGRLQLCNTQFCSGFLKQATLQADVPVAGADVVYWGVDTEMFHPDQGEPDLDDRRNRLLYVGQLVRHKGVHTAIEALRLLRLDGASNVTLTVVGGTVTPDYEAQLREQVSASGVECAVRFAGPVSRAALAGIYNKHGILIMPSCWDEPFAITPLEAMASGLLVVGTTRGGSAELFKGGINALTFPEEDAQRCAAQIQRALADPRLWRSLADAGRRTVFDRFSLSGMVDQIEWRLCNLRDVIPSEGCTGHI